MGKISRTLKPLIVLVVVAVVEVLQITHHSKKEIVSSVLLIFKLHDNKIYVWGKSLRVQVYDAGTKTRTTYAEYRVENVATEHISICRHGALEGVYEQLQCSANGAERIFQVASSWMFICCFCDIYDNSFNCSFFVTST